MPSNERPPLPHIVVSILALAAAYLTTGLAARALPLDADYPTAVWPPAGIALAAVLMIGRGVWPGVFLGSLLLNVNLTLDASNLHQVLWSVVPPVSISIGATLQALAGAWLVQRALGGASPLSTTRGMILLPLLGGFVACVLSASISTSALLECHLIEPEELPFSWFTWWVGDTIGVVSFTPLLLLLSDPSIPGGTRRRVIVAGPLMIAFLVVVLAFQFACRLEERTARSDFDRAAELAARALERELDEYLFALDEVQALFSISDQVSARQFDEFAMPLVRRYAGLRAIEWAPRVPPERRAAFIEGLRRDGHDVPAIFRLDDAGAHVPVTGDADAFPIAYIAGEGDNRAAYGFDLSSEVRRSRAMQRAAADGTPHATGPLRLVQSSGPGLLIFHAVREHRDLAGYAILALQTDDLVATWLRRSNTSGMAVTLYDRGTRGEQRVLLYGKPPDAPADLHAEVQLERAGRHWGLVFSAHTYGGQSLQAWSIMAGGMLLTGFLSMFMMVVSGQSAELEKAVAVRTAELDTLAQRLQHVLDSVGEGICGVDLECRTTFVNLAAARLTGHSAESLIGRPIHDVLHGAACDAACAFNACLHDGETRTGIDNAVTRADGTKLAIEYVKAPILEEGRITGGVLAFKDITERLAMERMKDEFVSVVSHELRTPLTAIQGVLGLLASGKVGQLPPSALRLAELGVRNSERLVLLVNDILDIERLESGQVVLERRACDAAVACHEVAEALRPVAERAGVPLEVRSTSLSVWADPMRLSQVLTNLVGNAIKFSESGNPVEVSAAAEGPCVRFEVRDQGRGIPADNLETIFERFRQVDSSDSRERGGTGLGLAICKSIVTQHGGRIWVESRPGEGSVFKFTLPSSDGTPT